MAIRTKWDGFLCLVFRDRERIDLQSESKQPLTCYFPEIREAVAGIAAEYFVPDGELAVPSRGALLQRIHPAPSRVAKLSMQTPAILIVFDLLAGSGGKSLLQTPLWKCRQHLEEFAHTFLRRDKRFRLLPITIDVAAARGWLAEVGTMLDGIIAKKCDIGYASGE